MNPFINGNCMLIDLQNERKFTNLVYHLLHNFFTLDFNTRKVSRKAIEVISFVIFGSVNEDLKIKYLTLF